MYRDSTMRLRHLLKLISGFTAGAIATVALLIFICPGVFMPGAASASTDTATLCQGDAGMPVGAGADGGCFSTHLATANLFTGSLAGKIILSLSVFLAGIIIYLGFSQTELWGKTRARLTRYKYRYRLRLAEIKLRYQKKIMAWLSLFKNYGIALLA